MLKYSFTNPQPLAMPFVYLTHNHKELYALDRQWAIHIEKLNERDLKYYDRDVNDVKLKVELQKKNLIGETMKKLNSLLKMGKEIKSFKLSLNKYNGYIVEYKDRRVETFNFLRPLYIDILLSY